MAHPMGPRSYKPATPVCVCACVCVLCVQVCVCVCMCACVCKCVCVYCVHVMYSVEFIMHLNIAILTVHMTRSPTPTHMTRSPTTYSEGGTQYIHCLC